MIKKLSNYKKDLGNNLNMHFADKMNEFIVKYKNEQDAELEAKTKELMEQKRDELLKLIRS